MILLDTDVVSEPLRPEPETRIIDWIDAQQLETLHLSAITVAEMRSGIAQLREGRRRARIQDNLEQRQLPLFEGRVLSFDLQCSAAYARIVANARHRGRPISVADAYIAATAATHGLTVATRDERPFTEAGLKVINPWRM